MVTHEKNLCKPKNVCSRINQLRKIKMLPLKDEEMKSNKNQKFCHLCKKKFQNLDDRDNHSNDNSNNYSNDKELHARKFYADARGLDDVDLKRNEKEFNDMRFNVVSRSY